MALNTEEYLFIDQGITDGVRYVDVLYRDGGDPVDYEVALDDAVSTYGECEIMTLKEWMQS